VPGFQSNTTRSICVLCAMIEPPPGIGKNNNRDDTNNDSMTDGWIHLLIAKVFHLHRPRSAAVWNTFPRPSGCQHNVLFASQSRKFCFPLPKLASLLVSNPFAIRRLPVIIVAHTTLRGLSMGGSGNAVMQQQLYTQNKYYQLYIRKCN